MAGSIAIAVDFKSGPMSSVACVLSHFVEEPLFQCTYYSLVGRINQAMNQN